MFKTNGSFGYLCAVNFELEKKFKEAIAPLSDQIGETPDLQSVMFLIGVRELGSGVKTFKKDEKLNLMHIAICTVLVPYGYYEYQGEDEDGWPHYENIKPLPPLNDGEQQLLMKEAIINYFKGL